MCRIKYDTRRFLIYLRECHQRYLLQRRAFVYGERLIDRLDFEELALKSFDTSLGPKLLPIGRHGKVKPEDHPTVSLTRSALGGFANPLTQRPP